MALTQELVDDAMDLLAHETMPELDLDELLMSIGTSVSEIEDALFRYATVFPSPPQRRTAVHIYQDPVQTAASPASEESPYLSEERLRILRHMR